MFLRTIFYLLFVSSICACIKTEKEKTTKTTEDYLKNKPKEHIDTTKISLLSNADNKELAKLPDSTSLLILEDSIVKWIKYDSFKISNRDFRVNINHCNGIKYAFIDAYPFSEKPCLNFYVSRRGKWIKVYQIYYQGIGMGHWIEKNDINHDGYCDLSMVQGVSVYGNSYPIVFLYDTTKKSFTYQKCLSIYNVDVNIKDSLVKSHWQGGVYTNHSQSIYRWKNDSLILLEECYFEPSCGQNKSCLEHIRNVNNTLVRTHKKYSFEKGWAVYEKLNLKINSTKSNKP